MLAKRNNFFETLDSIFNDVHFSDVGTKSKFLKAKAFEDDNNYNIELEVPGIKKENLDISVNDSYLTVKGTKEESKKNNLFNEFYYGSFERSFKLPKNVNTENIKASTKDGVLTINIEKRETIPKSKKIQIT